MNSILKIIYDDKVENGNVLKNNSEYDTLSKKANELFEKLEKVLTKEQNEILSDIWLTDSGAEYEAGYSYFKEGVKTCMIILEEIFKKD